MAAELDIGESTVDDYVKRGALPKPIQFGGAVRWDWKQVDAALRSLASPETANIDLFMAGIDNVKAE
ncbi:helix-turn-helix transcriptional regulator [Mesorhizobium sp. ASY16-5R]|uniref:helix-turn-helix transcriptional regulator n=1 Tax=Mesorhizobium sp. ASY16-5R TaxID=3445772 RepID=UPI003FA17BD0